MRSHVLLLTTITLCCGCHASMPSEPSDDAPAAPEPSIDDVPVTPIGFDAYRSWQRMFQLRIGTRTMMSSTYDRCGGNEGADASHFLRQEAPTRNVTLDVDGPGVLYFVRTNHWHGSPWHYGIDGRDHA